MSVAASLSEILHRIGAVRFGDFELKDGRRSPFYLDLRILVSHPDALAKVARALTQRAQGLLFDRLAGLPYAGLPLAVAMSLISGTPMVYARKEAKRYGTSRLVELRRATDPDGRRDGCFLRGRCGLALVMVGR